MILAPTLWNVPTRSRPASPASSALMSAFAASSLAWIASACLSRIRPASVSEIGRGPPGRSISLSPTMRSSVAICCETADCVYPSTVAAAEIEPRSSTSAKVRSRWTSRKKMKQLY